MEVCLNFPYCSNIKIEFLVGRCLQGDQRKELLQRMKIIAKKKKSVQEGSSEIHFPQRVILFHLCLIIRDKFSENEKNMESAKPIAHLIWSKLNIYSYLFTPSVAPWHENSFMCVCLFLIPISEVTESLGINIIQLYRRNVS